MIFSRRFLVYLGAAFLFLHAQACSCLSRSMCEILDSVKLAAVGTIVELAKDLDGTPIARFHVDLSIKGGLKEGLIHEFAAGPSAACKFMPQVGVAYALTFDVDDESNLIASTCNINVELQSMSAEDMDTFLKYPISCESNESSCPAGVARVNCLMDPCATAKCEAYSTATCKADYCGGCNARFYYNDVEVTASCETSQDCPPDMPRVRCLEEPCQVTKCYAFPEASCTNDNCGGCKARFYYRGAEVSSHCQLASICPNGNQREECSNDPCQSAACEAFPEATCKVDHCNGCKVHFYVNGQDVTNICQKKETYCPDGSAPLECFMDPCPSLRCHAYPRAVCKPSYCNSCGAKYYANGIEVTNNCDDCPEGKPMFTCFTDPCFIRECRIYPSAVCKPDYCGGCNAVFYVNDTIVQC